jgi:hypothetical protein
MLLHTFTPSNAIFGIIEYETGNSSATTANSTCDANHWAVDLHGGTTAARVKVRKLAHLPDVQITGLAAMSSATLLFTDPWAGNRGAVNVRTGTHSVVLQDASTANNASAPLPSGRGGSRPTARTQSPGPR